MKQLRDGFTLMELLAVIGIIMLLSAVLFPAFSKAREMARRARARTDAKQTEIAFKALLSDYGSWSRAQSEGGLPLVVPGGGKQSIDKELVVFLAGGNSRKMPYMEFSSSSTNASGQFADPWKSPFYMVIGNREVTTPQAGKLYRDVAVWSLGADLKEATKDDVASWE